ncbi:MAG: PQQ-binding-like beta-propeller repeat protein, partial [Phycisphaerales bacterium]|nr:PQQ-binding-like beta-propeller repeat protein [Phycisphaerales bacterium]
DLKPSNVLISHDGDRPSARVIDFGVAKATAEPLTDKTLVTGIRQLVGTPLYMSPEQAGQSDLDIDTRSDIYTLGVLLYELLTGVLPFDPASFEGAGYAGIQHLICDIDPPRPSSRLSRSTSESSMVAENRRMDRRQLVGMLRGDLDAIVMKCLEKRRDRRYESAASLAEDISRFLRDEVVHARSPGFGYRARKFVHRNRIAAVASLLVTIALLSGSSLAVWGMIQARKDRDDALAAKAAESEQSRIATERAESLRRELYRSTIMRISDIVNSGTADPIKMDLDACDADLIHWEWRRLRMLADTSDETIATGAGAIRCIRFDPSGERYLLAEESERISLRSAIDHRTLRSLVHASPAVAARDVQFSLDGRRAASANDENSVFVWDVESGEVIRRIDLAFGNLLSVALDGDGGRIAVGSFWNDTYIFDVASGREMYRLKPPAHRARSLQFFDGGRLLMIGSLATDVCVFDVDRGVMVWHEPVGEFVIWSARVSPAEDVVVATSGDARIAGFGATSGDRLFDEHVDKVERGAMAIDDASGLIFLAAEDGLITAYDLKTGERRFVLRGHEAGVSSLAVNPRTGALLSTSSDGVIKRWDVRRN